MPSLTPKLSRAQRNVAKAIKRLHAAGEPLNITAVKRRHPELINEVFAIQPFWGLKRALVAAGIDYSEVRVELADTVPCRVCGEEFVALPNHLALRHGIDTDDYRLDYPDAETFSETLRRSRTRMRSAIMRHWEPLWTPEYVQDRISEFHTRGIRLSIPRILRREPALLPAAERHFGKWSRALESVGIGPKEARLMRWMEQRKYRSREAIVREIRRRADNGLPINRSALNHGSQSDYGLTDCARYFFASWPAAMRAAGFDPSAFGEASRVRSRKYRDVKAVIAAIRRRSRLKLPINAKAIVVGETRDYPLYLAAQREFGLWAKALIAAGRGPHAIGDRARAADTRLAAQNRGITRRTTPLYVAFRSESEGNRWRQ